MLTGDSADTAKTIGYESRILCKDETKYDLFYLDAVEENQLERRIEEISAKIKQCKE